MLIALGATLKFLSKDGGESLMPVESFFERKTEFEKSILLECQLSSSPYSGSSFVKLCRRMSGYAVAMAAAKVRLDERSREIQDIRIGVGAISRIPRRLKEVEEMLHHKEPSIENIARACEGSADHIQDPVPSVHASVEYKKQVLPSLLREAIATSVERAQEM